MHLPKKLKPYVSSCLIECHKTTRSKTNCKCAYLTITTIPLYTITSSQMSFSPWLSPLPPPHNHLIFATPPPHMHIQLSPHHPTPPHPTHNHLILPCRIRKDYEAITDKALTTPTNTSHLMELKAFVEQAEKKDLCALEGMMEQAMHHMEFLISHSTMTHSEMRMNSETFQWLQRIPSVLEEHREIITRSRREAEEALKVCVVCVCVCVCVVGVCGCIHVCVYIHQKHWAPHYHDIAVYGSIGQLSYGASKDLTFHTVPCDGDDHL